MHALKLRQCPGQYRPGRSVVSGSKSTSRWTGKAVAAASTVTSPLFMKGRL